MLPISSPLVCWLFFFSLRASRTTRSRCGNARASPINTTWKMIHCTNKSLNVLYYIFALHCVRSVLCSEFPERECCDTVYSAIPNPEPAPTSPTLLTHVIPSTITANHTGNYVCYQYVMLCTRLEIRECECMRSRCYALYFVNPFLASCSS